MMESLLSNARAFVDGHGVRFVIVHILDILEVMMSSNFLACNSRATYIRYKRVGKMMLMKQGVILFPGKLGKNPFTLKTLVSSHPGDPASTYLLRRISLSCFGPLTRLSNTITNLPFSKIISFIDISGAS